MSLTKECTVNNKKPELESNIIDKLHKFYQDYSKTIVSVCPACNSDKYIFAFDKYVFHYVQCINCKSLYVQNNLNKNNSLSYEKSMQKEYYSKLEYKKYLDELIKKMSFELELTYSRLFSKKTKLKILYFGNKSKVYKEGLKRFNVDFDINTNISNKKYDCIILDHFIEKVNDMEVFMDKIKSLLSNAGYLYISMRVGTGIDILTLWEDSNLYPLEHNKLLSIDGIQILLENNNFIIKELNTPGILDIDNILKTKSNKVPRFLNYLRETNNKKAIEEFQTFIQKSLLSSFATIIAQRG